jgi:putative hydrolase of the HAD superfamily
MNNHSNLNWHSIHTVLLDMDGTLLDLNFDNQFWLHHLPQRYAQQYHLTFEEAKTTLLTRYRAKIGTLQWYCVDYWSTEFNLDVAALKQEIAHLIDLRPQVSEFLHTLRAHQKRTLMVTNAHPKSLTLKMQRTQIAHHFDRLVCAHDIGIPKEVPEFWEKLQQLEPFNPAQTLLIDDSLPILRSAANYGIAHLLGIAQPDTQAPPKETEEFRTLYSFQEIMP